jgi:hypothetical protein
MLDLPEARRLLSLGRPVVHGQSKRARLSTNTALFAARRQTVDHDPGVRRLVRFLLLLAEFDSAPWANIAFELNNTMIRRLTQTHLAVIVGEHYTAEKAALEAMVNSPDRANNVVWITNRQQGKTSTLAKFLAALTVLSPHRGSLCCVYSTNYDRATELLKAAKMYLDNMPAGHPLRPTVLTNNERSITVRTVDGSVHTVAARPRNADSCRGDAPASAMFDEIAFVQEDFWYKFAYPLLQVGKRVFTCATTPAPFGSFFSRFVDTVRERNAVGDFFFRLINHSLVCEDCERRNIGDKCAHRLMLVPPWKSVLRFHMMRKLVPEARAEEFAAEVYGVLAKRNNGYMPSQLVEAWRDRPVLRELATARLSPVYLAVDPPSHQSSRFGMAAIIYGERGEIVILGLSECRATRCDSLQLQACVGEFTRRLRRHRWVLHRPIVPIIETNNNGVLALSLLRVVERYQPVSMPFIEAYFATDITDAVGVRTTEVNKAAMCQLTMGALMDGRLFSGPDAVTVGRDAWDPNQDAPLYAEAAALLALELMSFRDLPNGKISGKVDASQSDDLGMALMMAIYWSTTCRALNLITC